MNKTLYLVKWPAGEFSVLIGTGKGSLLDCIDEIGDPSDVEVRIIPDEFYGLLSFDQRARGEDFEWRSGDNCFDPGELWEHCTKKVWPELEYSSHGSGLFYGGKTVEWYSPIKL